MIIRFNSIKGLQGGSYKQALCSDGQRLIVTEADVNKSSIQIYDIDYLDFDDSSDSDFSEFERFQRYAGSGNYHFAPCHFATAVF